MSASIARSRRRCRSSKAPARARSAHQPRCSQNRSGRRGKGRTKAWRAAAASFELGCDWRCGGRPGQVADLAPVRTGRPDKSATRNLTRRPRLRQVEGTQHSGLIFYYSPDALVPVDRDPGGDDLRRNAGDDSRGRGPGVRGLAAGRALLPHGHRRPVPGWTRRTGHGGRLDLSGGAGPRDVAHSPGDARQPGHVSAPVGAGQDGGDTRPRERRPRRARHWRRLVRERAQRLRLRLPGPGRRVDLVEEQLQVITGLWSQDPFSHAARPTS